MQLSVVVPCFNEARNIAALMEALAKQQALVAWEVVVSDNGSTDATRTVVEGFLGQVPGLRVVDAAKTRGAAFARNVGAAEAEGRWIVFCDADDVVGSGWLAAMARALEDHPVVIPRFEGLHLNPGSAFRPLAQQDGLDPLWYPPYLAHSGGSGIGIWRECHEQIGGFDETLRICEDTDYTVRLQIAGYPLHFEPEAVLHIRYPKLSGYFHQARSWARANTIIYKRYGQAEDGEDRTPWRWFAAGIWRMVRRIPRLRRKRVQAYMLWESGWHLGLLEGAIAHRVPPVAIPPRSPEPK